MGKCNITRTLSIANRKLESLIINIKILINKSRLGQKGILNKLHVINEKYYMGGIKVW